MGMAVWGLDPLQNLDTASGMLSNSLQEVQTLFMRQLGKIKIHTNWHVLLKELCWAPLLSHWRNMVVCYCNQMAKASTGTDEGCLS